jgi:hypothetical protein
MATGMAIMGFGGGALIASPRSVWLMSKFSTPKHVGVAETFVTLRIVYGIFMLVGSAIMRVRLGASLGHDVGNLPGQGLSGCGGGFRRPHEPEQHGRPLRGESSLCSSTR